MGTKKGCRVKKIFGEENILLQNYVIFDDNWISEYDTVLLNENGDRFSILDYKELKENILVIDTLPYNTGLIERNVSCIKLDKKVNVGDVFYLHY